MPTDFLNELSKHQLPVRLTDPALIALVHRLNVTGQLKVVYGCENGTPFAEMLAITPLGARSSNEYAGKKPPYALMVVSFLGVNNLPSLPCQVPRDSEGLRLRIG